MKHNDREPTPRRGSSMPRHNHNPNPARHHDWHAPDGKVYELVDLPHGHTIEVSPSPEDLARAVPRNPHECAIAQERKRSTHAPAQIGTDKAILPRLIEGKLTMLRTKVPASTRRGLDTFDATGELPDGGFLFKGVPPSETIDSQRATDKRRRARWGSKPRPGAASRVGRHLRNASRAAQIFVREDPTPEEGS